MTQPEAPNATEPDSARADSPSDNNDLTDKTYQKGQFRAHGTEPCNAVWQPIETVPKTGTYLLLTDGEEVGQASWWVSEWMIHIGNDTYSHVSWLSMCYSPTHWMPLPPPPGAALHLATEAEAKP